jgi:hypothetical protein
MYLVQLENITFKPLLVIAEDFDHAAQIFMCSLINGLGERPDADFDVTKWRIKDHRRNDIPWSWVDEGSAGMLWNVDEGTGWLLNQTELIRE